MGKSNFTELSIIQETKKRLEKHGDSELLYLTAEFSPFTNQQRPDLKFIFDGLDDFVFFIEYKLEPNQGFDLYYFKGITEHKEFVQENLGVQLKYAFATNSPLDAKFKEFLKQNDIVVFSIINSSKELFDRILGWAKTI